MTEPVDDNADVDITPDELSADTGEAPALAGDDVRPGPELTDEPVAGSTEPVD